MCFRVVVIGAMAEVQPEYIDTGTKQFFQHFWGTAGGTNGGNNLGVSFSSHTRLMSVAYSSRQVVHGATQVILLHGMLVAPSALDCITGKVSSRNNTTVLT